jgi:hypothetical protein
MSCRFMESSEHNLQLLMFGQKDGAEQESGFAQGFARPCARLIRDN